MGHDLAALLGFDRRRAHEAVKGLAQAAHDDLRQRLATGHIGGRLPDLGGLEDPLGQGLGVGGRFADVLQRLFAGVGDVTAQKSENAFQLLRAGPSAFAGGDDNRAFFHLAQDHLPDADVFKARRRQNAGESALLIKLRGGQIEELDEAGEIVLGQAARERERRDLEHHHAPQELLHQGVTQGPLDVVDMEVAPDDLEVEPLAPFEHGLKPGIRVFAGLAGVPYREPALPFGVPENEPHHLDKSRYAGGHVRIQRNRCFRRWCVHVLHGRLHSLTPGAPGSGCKHDFSRGATPASRN